METALNEITLVLFTTIAPAGTVGYLVAAAAIMRAGDGARAVATSRYLVIPLVLAITGLIASATHLGTPANALYVLTGVGRSPLSNEVVAAVAFLALGGIYWIVSFRDDVTPLFRRVWLALTCVAGLAFTAAVSMAYSVPSVPTWSLPTAPATLWLNALSSGPLVGMVTLAAARQPLRKRASLALLAVAGITALANVAVLAAEWQALGGIVTTTTRAADLVPPLAPVAGAYLTCTALALVACAFAALRDTLPAGTKDPFAAARRMRTVRLTLAGLGVLLALAGCFAVRFTFYMMHMTLGI